MLAITRAPTPIGAFAFRIIASVGMVSLSRSLFIPPTLPPPQLAVLALALDHRDQRARALGFGYALFGLRLPAGFGSRDFFGVLFGASLLGKPFAVSLGRPCLIYAGVFAVLGALGIAVFGGLAAAHAEPVFDSIGAGISALLTPAAHGYLPFAFGATPVPSKSASAGRASVSTPIGVNARPCST